MPLFWKESYPSLMNNSGRFRHFVPDVSIVVFFICQPVTDTRICQVCSTHMQHCISLSERVVITFECFRDPFEYMGMHFSFIPLQNPLSPYSLAKHTEIQATYRIFTHVFFFFCNHSSLCSLCYAIKKVSPPFSVCSCLPHKSRETITS